MNICTVSALRDKRKLITVIKHVSRKVNSLLSVLEPKHSSTHTFMGTGAVNLEITEPSKNIHFVHNNFVMPRLLVRHCI